MNLKIGYFADGPWSHEAFNLLIQEPSIDITFICARYDSNDEILEQFAKRYNIPFLKHPDINSNEFHTLIKNYPCDLFVSMSFNQIFKPITFTLPRLKTINCHAGKLPFYRGRNILNWALINDEKEFGITVHYIDDGIDTGDIILQRTFPITDDDTYATLLNIAYTQCAKILFDAILLIRDANVIPIQQSSVHPIGFYCSQRKIGDEKLHWNQPSRDIFNFIRSICPPGPCAQTVLNGLIMDISKAKYLPDAPSYKGIPGVILNKSSTGSFIVKTSDSFIEIIDYTYAGKFKTGDRFEII